MDLVGRPAVLLELDRLLGIGAGRSEHGGAGISRHRFAIGAEQAMDRLADGLAQRSQRAASTAPMVRTPARSLRASQIETTSASRCIGSRPIGMGFRWVIRPCPSIAAGVRGPSPGRHGPRHAPSSVAMRKKAERARAGEPAVLAVLRRRDVVPERTGSADVGDLHDAVLFQANERRFPPCVRFSSRSASSIDYRT